MAWTTPRTWVTGEVVTSTEMNTHLRDNLNALHNTRGALLAAVAPGGNHGAGATYTITAPEAGTYVIEWGAASAYGDSQGDGSNIQSSIAGTPAAAFSDVGMSGGPALMTGVVLTSGQVVTFTVSASSGAGVTNPWAKLYRTA